MLSSKYAVDHKVSELHTCQTNPFASEWLEKKSDHSWAGGLKIIGFFGCCAVVSGSVFVVTITCAIGSFCW